MNKSFNRDADEVIKKLNTSVKRFSGKTVLLTGACGFIGSQFCHFFMKLNDLALLGQPVKLIAIDNFMRGVPKWVEENDGLRGFQFINSNVVTQSEFPDADFIIHAASIASPLFYRKYPIETMDANVIGLRNILDWSISSKPESILYFSTSEIYGDPNKDNIPTEETYRGNVSCTGPRACYDESKRFGETLCVNFWQQFSIPIKIARPFNNYGPGLKLSDRRVLPDFFRNALANEDITILSDGTATRTFCYITDAKELLGGVLQWFSWLRKLWVAGGYSGQPFADWVKEQRPKLKVEVVKRSDDMEGFEVLPRRWVVERTFGWLMQQRRLVRDYEKTETSA